jgi:predicted ABC-type ATPase
LIAKDELGGYSLENFAKAEMLYRERMSSFIRNGNDLMIESNLAKSNDYEWIEKMGKQGFEVILLFMSTDDENININRVQRRVKEGGHDIPVEIILHRYKMGIIYLKGKLHLFSEVYLIDNSTEEAIEVAQIKKGTLTELITPLPQWVEKVLYIFKKMKN